MSQSTPILTALQQARGDWTPTDYSLKIALKERIICIASDAHIPYHDERLIAFMFEECIRRKVQAIVWLGDLLDMPHFSSYDEVDKTVRFQRDLQIVRVVLETADQLPGIQRQVWSMGNHEARYMRTLHWQVNLTHLAFQAGLTALIEADRLTVSDNPSLTYLDGTWLLTHPKSYGPTPLVVPGKLADRFNVNVVSAHAHHYGMGVSPMGSYTVVETGGLFNPKLHEYIQHQVTTHRAWQQGFWIIENGQVSGYRGEHRARESA